MPAIKRVFCSVIGLGLMTGGLFAQSNRILVFPSGGSPNVTLVDAATLGSPQVIVASPNAFQGVVTPDGSKYYIMSRTTTRTITSVPANNLAAPTYISLSAGASAGVLTPDGTKLLVSAGTLKVFRTDTDAQVADVAVGGGPTTILVTDDSKHAYTLSSGGQVWAVDLTMSPPAATQIVASGVIDMALAPDNSKVVVLLSGNVSSFDTHTNTLSATPIPLSGVTGGKVLVTPDSARAIVVNSGIVPFSNSFIVNLSSGSTTQIGGTNQGFNQIVIIDNLTAFGVVNDGTVAKINLDPAAGPPAPTTVQSYGANTRAMDVSTNGKALYLISLTGSSITRVDVGLNTPSPPGSTSLGIAPSSLSVAIPPPTTGGAIITLNGGDQQTINQTTTSGSVSAIPLSVKITDINGYPVFNSPVTFSTTASGVSFIPAQPSLTDINGIAEAFVSVPAAPSSLKPEGSDPIMALAASAAPVEDVTSVIVTANAPGIGAITFTLNIGVGTGITLISGNYQITGPGQPYPLPLVVRVTDENGVPVPPGTVVAFQPLFGLGYTQTQTDNNGFASTQFPGLSQQTLRNLPLVTYQAQAYATSGNPPGAVTFTLTTSITAPFFFGHFSGDGDMQSGPVGGPLPIPLSVEVTNGFGQAVGPVNVYWSVVSGPAGSGSATFNPSTSLAIGGATTTVTLGPKGGTVVVRASIPGPNGGPYTTEDFTLTATQPPPNSVTILQGNNQQGNPGAALGIPLVVQVKDQFGNPFPLPNAQYPITFTVSPSGAATLGTISQTANGQASVQVTLGTRSGPFTVTAAIGSYSATFTLTTLATPAGISVFSGNSQQVSLGGTTASPVVLRVADNVGNPVAGVPVTIQGPSSITLTQVGTSSLTAATSAAKALSSSPAAGSNPLTINSDANGKVSFNITAGPGTAVGSSTITAGFSQNGVSASTAVTLLVVGSVPSFTASSVVNAASFQPGMVPYGLATLFGTGLSQITGFENPGGATTWKGTTVKIEGVAVPLFLVGSQNGQEQINFQVRADLGAPASVHVQVDNNGSSTVVSNVPVLPAQPGLFEYTPQGSNTKYAVALIRSTNLSVDNTLVGPGNPVARGDYLQIYLTGLGQMTPALQTGQAGSSTPPLVTTLNTPTVFIGNQNATVTFSGVAPGFVGLYQINAQVPAGVTPGNPVPLIVIQNGTASQTTQVAVK